jgi:hypothetical protein
VEDENKNSCTSHSEANEKDQERILSTVSHLFRQTAITKLSSEHRRAAPSEEEKYFFCNVFY